MSYRTYMLYETALILTS